MNIIAVFKLSKRFEKKYLIIFLIILIIGYFIYSVIESKQWGKESKPYTENFLKLLKNDNYGELYTKYAKNSGMELAEFKSVLSRLHDNFGRIVTYECVQDAKAYSGKTLTSFYIVYRIKFDSGGSFQGNFNIEIDKNSNFPSPGKIKEFHIVGGSGKKEEFYIKLLK